MNRRVLIADDDTSMQKIFKLIFERAGYSTTFFSDGKSVRAGNYPAPDLFILDRNLPDDDGLAICRYLKDRSDTQEIPVILVSATPGIADLAAAAGANGALEKPFNRRELLDLVDGYFRVGTSGK
jgi:CheY-like chemotaxis protein